MVPKRVNSIHSYRDFHVTSQRRGTFRGTDGDDEPQSHSLLSFEGTLPASSVAFRCCCWLMHITAGCFALHYYGIASIFSVLFVGGFQSEEKQSYKNVYKRKISSNNWAFLRGREIDLLDAIGECWMFGEQAGVLNMLLIWDMRWKLVVCYVWLSRCYYTVGMGDMLFTVWSLPRVSHYCQIESIISIS